MPAEGYGATIRALREQRGWSQTVLGEKAGGINKETVNRAEQDANVEIKTLGRIADALGVPIAELFPAQQFPSLDTQPTTAQTGSAAVTSPVTPQRHDPAQEHPNVPTDEVSMLPSLAVLLVPQLVAALALLSQEDQKLLLERYVFPLLGRRLTSFREPRDRAEGG